MYSQIDGRWSHELIPGSGGSMGTEGCYITAIANILTAAGHDTTPLTVLNALKANGGINGQGLVIHAKVTQAFPMFVYGPGSYALVQGTWRTVHGSFTHFIVKLADGSYVDSYYGRPGIPAGFSIGSEQPIAITGGSSPAPQPSVPRVTVTAGTLNVRAGSTTANTVVRQLHAGDVVPVYATVQGTNVNGNANWYKIDNGQYISAYWTK